jgi:aminoglycoside 6'-N-acetyltransferase I
LIDLRIEEISERHIPKVTEMVIKLWPHCTYEEEFANCVEIINSTSQTIFVAEANDDYVGFIQLSLRTDYVEGTSTSPVLYVEGLYIEPNYRNQGIANSLVEKSEDWGIEQNCTEIASDAELNNTDSIKFHESIGFTEVNRVVCFSKTIGMKQ